MPFSEKGYRPGEDAERVPLNDKGEPYSDEIIATKRDALKSWTDEALDKQKRIYQELIARIENPRYHEQITDEYERLKAGFLSSDYSEKVAQSWKKGRAKKIREEWQEAIDDPNVLTNIRFHLELIEEEIERRKKDTN